MVFFKKKEINVDYKLVKIGALLIHAAKIDEDFSQEEENIIKQTLLNFGAGNQNINEIIEKAKKMEESSNQILDYTKEVKNMEEDNKIKIVKTLWKIIFSNKKADIYEANLMRRLAGLLYIDSKIMGDIKQSVIEESKE